MMSKHLQMKMRIVTRSFCQRGCFVFDVRDGPRISEDFLKRSKALIQKQSVSGHAGQLSPADLGLGQTSDLDAI